MSSLEYPKLSCRVFSLAQCETESIRKSYAKVVDAYGSIGVLKLVIGEPLVIMIIPFMMFRGIPIHSILGNVFFYCISKLLKLLALKFESISQNNLYLSSVKCIYL